MSKQKRKRITVKKAYLAGSSNQLNFILSKNLIIEIKYKGIINPVEMSRRTLGIQL